MGEQARDDHGRFAGTGGGGGGWKLKPSPAKGAYRSSDSPGNADKMTAVAERAHAATKEAEEKDTIPAHRAAAQAHYEAAVKARSLGREDSHWVDSQTQHSDRVKELRGTSGAPRSSDSPGDGGRADAARINSARVAEPKTSAKEMGTRYALLKRDASNASAKANASGSKSDHQAAATAHRMAGMWAPNSDTEREHSKAERQHEKASDQSGHSESTSPASSALGTWANKRSK